VKQLIEYIRDLVLNAKGNAVSFTLKQAKKALETESKSEGGAEGRPGVVSRPGPASEDAREEVAIPPAEGHASVERSGAGMHRPAGRFGGQTPQPDGEGQPNALPDESRPRPADATEARLSKRGTQLYRRGKGYSPTL
jgi:hypothetical protein